jgi:hypothetical protein
VIRHKSWLVMRAGASGKVRGCPDRSETASKAAHTQVGRSRFSCRNPAKRRGPAALVVLGAFISAINSDLRRRARKRKFCGRLQTGSLTVVQRFGSSLNLNVHFHVIVMDGVYAEQPDGCMLFHPLPAPSDEDIARLARAVCRKVTRYLGQLTREDKEQQLTLDHLANASVQGLVATGPRRGCRV